nr:reverse transcriptase domain-containing protein [Pectobacterium atrosepticum]
MKYVRYADDILIGVIGSKQDCIMIKEALSNYLDSLGLTINQDKTLITCAAKKPAKFLGYNINITPRNKQPTTTIRFKNKTIRAKHNTRVIINAPIRDIVIKLVNNGFAKNSILGRVAIPTGMGR